MKAEIINRELPIVEHPFYKYERNKRKRNRFKKRCKRNGFTTFRKPILVINGEEI